MWRTLKEMTLKPSIAVHASGKQSSRTKADYFQSRRQGGGTAEQQPVYEISAAGYAAK